MARKCEICGKGTVAVTMFHVKVSKKKGVGQHIVTTKRVFKPNIVSVKSLVNGTTKTIKVCTRCLRSGRVQKVV